jgi:hypothetical protein
VFVVLWVLTRWTRVLQRRPIRLCAALVGVTAVSAAVVALFPRFYRGPFADVDPRIVPIWLDSVAEFRPLLRSPTSWAFSVPILATTAICVPALVYWSRRAAHRRAWAFMLVSCLFFAPLPFLQVRWGTYTQTLFVLPTAALIALVWARLDHWPFSVWRALAKAGLVLVCFYFLILSAFVVDSLANTKKPQEGARQDSLAAMCKYLNTAEPWQGRRARIVTHLFWGGEILYRTHHEVIATPYHRNAAGILDTHNILTADTDDKALALVRQREIDLILLCPESTEGRDYLGSEEAPTFYRRLRDGRLPPWCRPVDLPAELSSFLLFEVLRPDSSPLQESRLSDTMPELERPVGTLR